MRILLAEDDAGVAQVVRRALEDAGFSLDVAPDGIEAQHLVAQLEYGAIVLDLGLPGVDGWEILRQLRSEGDRTPVLILTGHGSVDDRVRGLDEGADDYLPKPFECRELVARLRALIRRAAAQPAPSVGLGDLEVNMAARTVSKAGAAVHLTAKEFALLELLLLNRGRPVSRSRIYHHLYNDEEDTTSNVLDVYVSSLRKKLGHWLVRTRRGEGYVIPETVDLESGG